MGPLTAGQGLQLADRGVVGRGARHVQLELRDLQLDPGGAAQVLQAVVGGDQRPTLQRLREVGERRLVGGDAPLEVPVGRGPLAQALPAARRHGAQDRGVRPGLRHDPSVSVGLAAPVGVGEGAHLLSLIHI